MTPPDELHETASGKPRSQPPSTQLKPEEEPRTESQPVTSSKSEAELSALEKKVRPDEIGGPQGLEPTRFGDWEVNGRCSDF